MCFRRIVSLRLLVLLIAALGCVSKTTVDSEPRVSCAKPDELQALHAKIDATYRLFVNDAVRFEQDFHWLDGSEATMLRKRDEFDVLQHLHLEMQAVVERTNQVERNLSCRSAGFAALGQLAAERSDEMSNYLESYREHHDYVLGRIEQHRKEERQ